MSLSETDETITYKMILIGDSSVGKTCLFKKFAYNFYLHLHALHYQKTMKE